MLNDALYTIQPIFLGSMTADKGNSLYRYPKGEIIRSVYACFALRGNGETILVDSGLPSQQDIRTNHKPFRQMNDAREFTAALAGIGIEAAQIRKVILTHMHYDHCCNLRLLPNLEKVYVQKRELLHAVSPREDELYYYSLLPECGKPEWTDALGKLELLDGDGEILPGIRVILTPGHSPGSQTVLVETSQGLHLLTGDFIALMDSYTNRIPNAIVNNLDEWYSSYDKVHSLAAARVLPGHDPIIFEQEVYG